MSILTHSTTRFCFDYTLVKNYKTQMINRSLATISLSEIETDILLEYFPNGICAFDLEMTGLSPLFDKIIEIAAVKLLPDRTVETYHSLVNPLISIPEHTIEYHGLTNEDLREMPSLKKPLKDFVDFYGNTPLLAHNAKFDACFIIRGIHEYNFPISLSDIFDSCRFARHLFKKHENPPKNFSLGELAIYFNIEFSHHVALDDAFASLKIFANSLFELKKQNLEKSLKDLSYLFKLNSFKKPESYILPRKLSILKDVVPTQTEIEIIYKGSSTKSDFRPVKPISLMPLPNGLVLYALCINSNMNKYFLLKKIKEIRSK